MPSAADNNWAAVAKNLYRARDVWRRMLRILNREGAAPRVSGLFLKAVVQAVLLLVLETWVVASRIGKALGRVQAQVVRQLTGRLPGRTPDGKWK